MTTTTAPATAAPAADPTATDTGRPVPRRYVIAAHLTALTALPSGMWRIVLGSGVTLGFTRAALEADDMPGWGTVQVVILSALSEAAALLTLGLVRPWGEVVPAWVPWLGGRRLPRLVVTIPAVLGGVAVTALWWAMLPRMFSTLPIAGAGWWALVIACYAPLLLWGPLLLWVTYGYHRRRAA